MTITEALNLALQKHQAGQLPEAQEMYRQILAAVPRYADALHLLGVATQQTGDNEQAVNLIRKAIEITPNVAEYHANLAKALRESHQPTEAVDACLRALELRPDYFKATIHLGGALVELSRWDEAIAVLSGLLQSHPDCAEAFIDLSRAFEVKNDLARAAAALQRAVELRPDLADVHIGLAAFLRRQRKFDAAIEHFRMAMAMRPESAELEFDLAATLIEARRPEEAREVLLSRLTRWPRDTAALHNLARTYWDTGQTAEAIDCYERILQIDPSAEISDSSRVFAMMFDPHADDATILREARVWSARHAAKFIRQEVTFANDPTPDRRLRIGFISPDFRAHSSALFTLPLFRNLDRRSVEIFLYASVGVEDELTAEFRAIADHWRDIRGVSDDAAAEMIRADQIDILVDLALHMHKSRLLVLARRPAPVQATWIGYPGTTGMVTVDYRLTDPYLDPPGERDEFYSEKSIRLPDTFWCYEPTVYYGPGAPQPEALPGAGNGYVTFGCLNNFCKINEGVLDLWGRVLSAVEGSYLILLAPPGSRRSWVLDRLGRHQVSADRVEFVPFQSQQEYLATFNRIDICLDTLPAGGHTTNLDSFWMGVPVVTLVGPTVESRGGWSQLCNLKLTELAAKTDDEFVHIATTLAGDLPRLTDFRRTLRQRMQASPLMDAPRFARGMEAAYRSIWRTWCSRITS
jgi:protein O-GlcNAc transferase